MTDTDDIHSRAAEARAEIDRLNTAASIAKEKANRAAQAFEQNPNAETHSENAVAAKLAENANKKAQMYMADVATLLADSDRANKRAELARLAARLTPDEFRSHQERAAELIADLRRELRGTLVAAHEAVVASNAARERARSLAEELGEPNHFPAFSLPYLFERIAPATTVVVGRDGNTFFSVVDTGFGAAGLRFTLQVNEPILGGVA